MHLCEDSECIVLFEGTLGQQLLEELSAAEGFHHHVHVLIVADDLDEVDNVGVLELAQDVSLHAQRIEEIVVFELLNIENLWSHMPGTLTQSCGGGEEQRRIVAGVGH